ncbi:MAG: energy transducer TonB [Bacteroidia bacterium]
MEPKKTERADVDKRRGMFFMGGLIFSLLVVIVAFTIEEQDPEPMELTSNLMLDEDEEIILNTQQEEKPPPPPPPPELEVVDDEEEIEEDQPELEDVDVDEDVAMDMPDIEAPTEEVKDDKIFVTVEQAPSFPGGEAKLYEYINKNLKYPTMEKENNIQGTAVLTFVVERDGSISNIKVLKGVSQGIDEEAKRVVRNMPRWTPGEQRNRPVRVQFVLPIRFVLSY